MERKLFCVGTSTHAGEKGEKRESAKADLIMGKSRLNQADWNKPTETSRHISVVDIRFESPAR